MQRLVLRVIPERDPSAAADVWFDGFLQHAPFWT
jgi:hypothetical protein